MQAPPLTSILKAVIILLSRKVLIKGVDFYGTIREKEINGLSKKQKK